MLLLPAMPVHGHWDPVIHTAELPQRSLALAVDGPGGWGKDCDTLVGLYRCSVCILNNTCFSERRCKR